MKPIFSTYELNATGGHLGVSFLRMPLLGGEPERITMVYVRDWSGNSHNVLLMPAAALRSAY